MGIKDFYKYVKTRWPECFTTVRYEALAYQRVAVDMMNVLYVFRARNDQVWMKQCLQFLMRLRSKFVHVVCVFDHPQTHPLKQATVDKRREDRERGRHRAQTLRAMVDEYIACSELTPELEAFLTAHPECVSALTHKPIVGALQDYVDRLQRAYSLSFRTDEIQAIQALLRALGYCVLQAESDGEALCAYLSALGAVDAVLSNDSDVFFFGAKYVLFRFTDEGAYLIDSTKLLEDMGLTRAQFTELCLLCGTDFNASVRGVGFCRAYALVQEHSTLESETFPLTLDHALLRQVRAFADPQRGQSFCAYVHYCRPSQDPATLSQICFRYQIDLSLDELMAYTRVELVLMDA